MNLISVESPYFSEAILSFNDFICDPLGVFLLNNSSHSSLSFV